MADADTQTFTVTPTTPAIDEDTVSANVTVALAAKPLLPVWVYIDSPYSTETQQLELTPASQSGSSGVTATLALDGSGRANSMITFDDSTYATPQTVLYRAVNDELFEQLHSGTLSMTAVPANNAAPRDCLIDYTVGVVTVKITDDDLARVTEAVSPTAVETQTLALTTGVKAGFPPGALTGVTTTFDVKELRTKDMSAPPSATTYTTESSVVSFEPSTNFSQPVEITLPLTTSSAESTVHFIGASSVSANDWAPVTGTSCTGGLCSVNVTHFSVYALATVAPTLTVTGLTSAALTVNEDEAVALSPLQTLVIAADASQVGLPTATTLHSVAVRLTRATYVKTEDVIECTNLTITAWNSNISSVSSAVNTVNCTEMSSGGATYHTVCWKQALGELRIAPGRMGVPTDASATMTVSAAQALLITAGFIKYRHAGDRPDTRTRKFEIELVEPFSTRSIPLDPWTSVTLVPVNDPPVIVLSSSTLSYTEKSPATLVDALLTVTDPDNNIQSATATMTTFVAGTDNLDVSSVIASETIKLSLQSAGALQRSGVGTPASYQASLRALQYQNDGPHNPVLTRNVTFTVTDVGGLTARATKTLVIVPVNDPPTVQSILVVVDEDSSVAGVNFLGSDPENDALTYEVTCNATKGVVTLSSDGQKFTYVPNTDEFGTDSFVYKAVDTSNAESDLASVDITISPQPDQPKSRDVTLTLTSCTPAQVAQARAVSLDACDDSAGYAITLEGYDPDVDSTLYNLDYTIQSEPPAGTLALTSASSVSTAAGVKQRGSNPATLTLYTADLLAAGGAADGSTTYLNFTYTAKNALFESTVATVSIAVKALVSTSTTPPVGYNTTDNTVGRGEGEDLFSFCCTHV